MSRFHQPPPPHPHRKDSISNSQSWESLRSSREIHTHLPLINKDRTPSIYTYDPEPTPHQSPHLHEYIPTCPGSPIASTGFPTRPRVGSQRLSVSIGQGGIVSGRGEYGDDQRGGEDGEEGELLPSYMDSQHHHHSVEGHSPRFDTTLEIIDRQYQDQSPRANDDKPNDSPRTQRYGSLPANHHPSNHSSSTPGIYSSPRASSPAIFGDSARLPSVGNVGGATGVGRKPSFKIHLPKSPLLTSYTPSPLIPSPNLSNTSHSPLITSSSKESDTEEEEGKRWMEEYNYEGLSPQEQGLIRRASGGKNVPPPKKYSKTPFPDHVESVDYISRACDRVGVVDGSSEENSPVLGSEGSDEDGEDGEEIGLPPGYEPSIQEKAKNLDGREVCGGKAIGVRITSKSQYETIAFRDPWGPTEESRGSQRSGKNQRSDEEDENDSEDEERSDEEGGLLRDRLGSTKSTGTQVCPLEMGKERINGLGYSLDMRVSTPWVEKNTGWLSEDESDE